MLGKTLDNFEIFRWNEFRPIEINGKEYQINKEPYLDIVLTDRCNRKCQFCIADLIDKKENCDVEVFKRQIDYAISHYGVKEVLIVGGEPTIAKGLFPILEHLHLLRVRDHKLKKICITTNGDMLKKEVFRNRLFGYATHVNLSLMHTDIQKQFDVAQTKNALSMFDLKEVYVAALCGKTELRINCNIFKGNLDFVLLMADFYESVKNYCDSVKFSPLLRVDDFSVVNKVTDFVKENILSDDHYENIFKGLEKLHWPKPIVRNPDTFGFVEYSMICMDTPIILNYNHRGKMADRARAGYINNIKLLTNGNLSLSWNKDDESRVIRKSNSPATP
jgi:molybdenum cofactor biosynthesis enzyme MoaA